MSGDLVRVYPIAAAGGAPALTSALVGGKAANLMHLQRIGLRVPPALALDTALCRDYEARGSLPDGFRETLRGSIRQLEEATGCSLGGRRPLLLSVRSSPPVSMPGMLDTVLNIGLTESLVSGLIRRTGNPWLAWDAYRRLIRMFAETVRHQDPAPFDRAMTEVLAQYGATSLQELDGLAMRALARRHRDQLAELPGAGLPDDPLEQVVAAVETVLQSWNSPRAAVYRSVNGVDSRLGTGVIIQAMVFGNSGSRSGSGVGFTRDPATGANDLYVDFLSNAQGEDVVSGRHAVGNAGDLARSMPALWAELQQARAALEREFRDMQDFEFTVEDGRLFFLQTRAGKRTPWAALQIATDLVSDGLIDPATALERLSAYDIETIARTTVRPDRTHRMIATAVPASIGVATGAAVFAADRAVELAARGPVILMRPDLATDDIAGLVASAGVVTTLGGRTSHAAVVARQLGKVCLVGCRALNVDADAGAGTLGALRVREGDLVTLDGETGSIYEGRVPVAVERPQERVALIRQWRAAAAGNPAPVLGILRS